MAVSVAAFLTRFPEFESTERSLIEAKLAEAAVFVDGDVWNVGADPTTGLTIADLGQGYKAASLLARTAFGRAARMVSKEGRSTYDDTFEDLQSRVAYGFRVI